MWSRYGTTRHLVFAALTALGHNAFESRGFESGVAKVIGGITGFFTVGVWWYHDLRCGERATVVCERVADIAQAPVRRCSGRRLPNASRVISRLLRPRCGKRRLRPRSRVLGGSLEA